jgi:putative phosphoesterase
MRILVLSDIHSSKRALDLTLKDIEEYLPGLLIICGDITQFGPASFADEFLNSINLKTLAVPGNCDPPEVLRLLEDKGVSVHGKSVTLEGFTFVGLGGSNVTPFNTITEFAEDYMFSTLDEMMTEDAVLVTHAPSYGYLDGPPGGDHYGSKAIVRIVEKYKPIVAMSGHIHEARGVVEDKGTLFFNPGPAMRGYRALLELTEDKAEVELLG